jgi:hypothetical protein
VVAHASSVRKRAAITPAGRHARTSDSR